MIPAENRVRQNMSTWSEPKMRPWPESLFWGQETRDFRSQLPTQYQGMMSALYQKRLGICHGNPGFSKHTPEKVGYLELSGELKGPPAACRFDWSSQVMAEPISVITTLLEDIELSLTWRGSESIGVGVGFDGPSKPHSEKKKKNALAFCSFRWYLFV